MRVSVTDVEQFRLIQQTDWASEAELVAKFQGKPFEQTWKQKAGCAWEDVLRCPDKYRKGTQHADGTVLEWYACDGHAFSVADVQAGLDVVGPQGVHQVKAERELTVDGEPVVIVGKADHLLGTRIDDWKLTFGQIDAQFYELALQWRFYLWLFGASAFRYCVFRFDEPKDAHVALREIYSVQFFPYADLEADCTSWLADFVRWARKIGKGVAA